METFGWKRHAARTSGWIGVGNGVVTESKWGHGWGTKKQSLAANSLVSEGAATQAVAPAETAQVERGDESNKRQRVEAVLLLSRAPVPTRKLSQLAGLADATEARTLVRQINQIYIERGRAFRAEEVAGGIQFLTRPQLAPWLRRLGHIPKTVQLTPPAMETLAIVAYRQPVLRADIEAIRGVACGEILKQLMERDLVRISGRSEELGRPYLYSTSRHFLQIFGLRGADALPALEEASKEFTEQPDWTNATPSSDTIPDQQPVTGVPEEDLDVSTAVADLATDNPECDNDAYVDLSDSSHVIPLAVDEDEDEVFADDDDEEDFDDDEEDWDDDDDEEEDDLEEKDAEEVDAEWEEVEDEEWDEEEEEGEDAEEEVEEEDDVDDDWVEDDDDDADDDEDEDEWD